MTDALPLIKGFLASSLIEWEGKVCSAIFLPGCNFRCPFCHASQLVAHADELETIPFASIAEHLDVNRGWIDGVEVSGGEPTIHRRLLDFILALRDHTPAVKLDTNGSHPVELTELIERGVLDFVAMDVKAPLGRGYSRAAGVEVDCGAIEASIDLLRQCGVEHEFRTTVVPGLHGLEDVVAIARLLGSRERLVLQQFAPLSCLDPAFDRRKPYDRQQLRRMAAAAGEFLAGCSVRGEPSLEPTASRR